MEVLSRISRLAITWTGSGPARSAPTASRRGNSTCSRRCAAPGRLPAHPGQLVRETGVTSGTMTNRVDRLTARRLVSREEHPADGRGVLVRLTDQGRETVDATLPIC